jgi:hypothetical protein
MRVGFRAFLALLGVFAVALAVTLAGRDGARATVTIDSVAVDADTTGNTATFVQAVDECASLAAPGNTTTIDVVLNQTVDNGLGSFGFDFVYDPAVIKVIQAQDNLLLASGGSFIPFDPQDPVPDTDGDFRIDLADLSTNYESGPGVFARFTVQAVGTGITTLNLANNTQGEGVPPTIGDKDAVAYDVLPAQGATLAVGLPCHGQADLQANAPVITAPSSAGLGTPFDVTVSGSIQNNGPSSPANADTTVRLSTPADCTADGGNQHVIQDTSVAAGPPVALPDQTFSVTCASPSFHTFAATITVSSDDPSSSDTTPGNNQASSDPATLAVLANADLSVSALTLSTSQLTPTPMAGISFHVDALVPVTNNGPAGPVSVKGLATITAPSDCGVYSPVTDEFVVSPAASETLNVEASFLVSCQNPGDHSFSVAASVSANDIHVTDAPGNNSGSGSMTATLKVGACGDDPNPAGNLIQNLSPQLLLLISSLTATGTPVDDSLKLQLDCQFHMNLTDQAKTPIDDCPVGLINEEPCTANLPLSIDLTGGSPGATPTVRLNPIGVTFLPADFDWAGDTEVPNGTTSGSADFGIRTDAGLLLNGIPCGVDVIFPPTAGYEGGIQGNVPESNNTADLTNPNVWPNDLNAERALVESSFSVPLLGTAIQLWSRTIVPLHVADQKIPTNILTWKITNPAFQAITGALWVVVPFPGDAVGPDPAGSIGGDPDADDPAAPTFPLTYCLPHHVTMTFSGMAGSTVFLSCHAPGSPMAWNLVDPDAMNVTGDEGPRSDTSTCSLDADGDGLSANAETYWGTNALSTDSDSDGVQDGPDNCKTLANPGQADYDHDGFGDPCDPDVDGDGVSNGTDACPSTALGVPVGSNGCSAAQVDSDGDGFCNPNALGTGPGPCTPGDNCPNTANPDQADGDGDGLGDACDGCPTIEQHWTVPNGDSDCDGFTNTSEQFVGTNPNSMCPANGSDDVWPADFNRDKHINVLDVSSFSSRFNHTSADGLYGVRFDFNGDSTINVLDVSQMSQFFNKSCG